MIAKCGSQIIWHWAHERSSHCDRWWETESEWHVSWKARFPEDWREVVSIDSSTGERHIADIKTPRGLVIELQNSTISEPEFRAREAFYKRMIWIVNGAPFAASFSLGPAVDPTDQFADARLIGEEFRKSKAMASSRRRRGREEDSERPQKGASMEGPKHPPNLRYHRFNWGRPRKMWLNATSPVFLDFGGDDLFWLKKHPAIFGYCVKLVSRDALIRKNGGDPVPGQ